MRSASRTRSTLAALLLALGLGPVANPLPGHAVPNNIQILSEHPITGIDGKTCLVADRARRITLATGTPPPDTAPVNPATSAFFPIVIAPCSSSPADYPSRWTFTDTREMRIVVEGGTYCLSARLMANFIPLLDPYLASFGALQPGSPFAFLASDLKPKGQPNLERLRRNPDLVAAPCGQKEGYDFWTYDDLTGMISTSPDTDDLGSRGRRCLTLHADWSVRPPRFQSFMPVGLFDCSAAPQQMTRPGATTQQRWLLGSGREFLPIYREPGIREYFDGTAGLPIVGPMGRCLTAEPTTKLVVTSDCDGRTEQLWRSSGTQIRLGREGDCLTRGKDDAATLLPCTHAPEQAWDYVVPDPVPNPKWQGSDIHARILPSGSTSLCLSVRTDPFVDPMRQRNRVGVAGCGAVLPRQTSWFRTDRIRTISIALVRTADNDGSNASMGKATEETIKKEMIGLAANLSRHFLALGVRFVFDPDRGYRQLNDGNANNMGRGATMTDPESPASRLAIAPLAGHDFYGRITIVAVGKSGGGASYGASVDFDPARMVDPLTLKSIAKPEALAKLTLDRMGLRLNASIIREWGVSSTWLYSSHSAHETGHYLGLHHTFAPDPFADTPEDTVGGDIWKAAGITTCGNLRTVVTNGKPVTPDRTNNEGYFGCLHGRSGNAFSPLQLGYMHWMLENQPNRYPLVACQPLGAYDANRLECESPDSLAICQQTSAYFKRTGGPDLTCESGGRHSRAMVQFIRMPAIRHMIQGTAPGKALLARLTSAPARPAGGIEQIAPALIANRNLALTMALNTRFIELQAAFRARNPAMADAAFGASSAPLPAPALRMIEALAPGLFTEGFLANLPPLPARE